MAELVAIREAWIAALNAHASIQALGFTFEDSPAILDTEIPSGERRGYVAVGDEQDQNGSVLAVQLITTVVASGTGAKEVLDLVDGAREAILAAFASTEKPGGYLGGLVGGAVYSGSQLAIDPTGRRVHNARHYLLTAQLVSPIQATL